MHNIVVIGASSGVGAAVSERLSARGQRVIGVARRTARLEAVASRCANMAIRTFDIGADADVKALFTGIAEEFGPVRGVVYCAGQQYIAPIRGTQRERLDELFQVNFMGAWSVIQAYSQKKIHSGPGSSFVAISSVAADRPEAGIVAYAASKAALNALVKGAAVECAPVRFNAIAPGFMQTEMTGSNTHIYTEAFVEQLAKRSPLGLASPDKVAALADFLLSDDASHITGQIMTLDGGATLK